MGSHSLLQGIFWTQGLNLSLLHCRQILYHLSHQGSPNLLLKPFQFLIPYVSFRDQAVPCIALYILFVNLTSVPNINCEFDADLVSYDLYLHTCKLRLNEVK